MKRTAKERISRDGRRVVAVTLNHGEVLLIVHNDEYFQLGGQVDDVVRGHVLADAARVSWCSIEQKWVALESIEVRAAAARSAQGQGERP